MSNSTMLNTAQALMDTMTPKFAVSYLRVSTRGQAERGGGHDEGFSIPAQREANKRRHYLLEQSSARNLSTVVHPPNPQTAHSFRLCLSTSKKTPIAWIT